jgi:hypothetical protein
MFSALNTITLIFLIFFSAILLGVFGLIFYYANVYLSQDIMIGAVNLSEANADSFGQVADAYIGKMDLIGYFIIFSLILGMTINAYYSRGKYPLVMLIIDVVLLVFAYIISVYVSNTYETFINSASILSIYINDMPRTSAFILRLPLYVSIIGVIMMIVSYIPIPRSSNEIIQNEDLEGLG